MSDLLVVLPYGTNMSCALTRAPVGRHIVMMLRGQYLIPNVWAAECLLVGVAVIFVVHGCSTTVLIACLPCKVTASCQSYWWLSVPASPVIL